MVGRDITPTEIGKHSKLIKAAQEEMSTMDVLVCGRCFGVYHFIEDFKQHKQKICQKENNNVRECNDTKPKIWAFLLWKATQLNNNKDTNIASPNSWALYQAWVKMDESLRETWIVAGKTIQSFAKVGQGGLQEMPVKITKTVVNTESASPGRKPLTQTKPQVANLKPPLKIPLDGIKDAENDISPLIGIGLNATGQKLIKKPVTIRSDAVGGINQTKLTNNANVKPLSRRAKRTVPNSDEVIEENVEKIVAKRFNPRRKMHEYLVKWEARTHEQNTWEPASHLENVPHLLETFETQLARQKETRAALQAKQQAAQMASSPKTVEVNKTLDNIKKETNLIKSNAVKLTTGGNNSDADNIKTSSALGDLSSRPSRTSKLKAMDQVKQWVSSAGAGTVSSAAVSPSGSDIGAGGNNSQDGEKDWSMNTSSSSVGGLVGVKRKLDDSDFNDSNASDMPSTTATMEDLEEDLIPSHTVKRMKNGSAVSVESKVVKVNGTSSTRTAASISGESLPVGPNSAEVIITQDTNASGVVKKPGFNSNSRNNTPKGEAQIRILSKGESAVSSTGIVRVSGSESSSNSSTTGQETKPTPVAAGRTQQQIRVGGRQTPNAVGNTQVSSLSRQQQVQRTPSGTTIQRKTIAAPGAQQRANTTTVQLRTGGNAASAQQVSSPTSGRMIIPRQGNANMTRTTSATTKTVTPEQKILQLSKSGDLKVTKKVMTREDAIAQRMNPRQQQQQTQVQIQKVQQITPPSGGRTSQVSAVSVRKQPDGTYAHEEQHQAQLCPITGKLIGQDDQVISQQHMQGGVLQSQLVQSGEQQLGLHQDQQQLQDIDSTLLLSNDQQMLTNDDGSPLLVTGEDGTVYQVAGKNAEGQTILVTQGPDGEQQFAYVAAAEGDENQVLTLDNAVAEAVAQLPAEQQSEALGEPQYIVKTTKEDGTTQVVTMSEAELAQHQALAAQQQSGGAESGTGATSGTGSSATGQLCIQTSDGADGQEANIPAEVVQAGLPSPGGTRRVVLLLQDGTYMMTEMHDDEFKALNIAA